MAFMKSKAKSRWKKALSVTKAAVRLNQGIHEFSVTSPKKIDVPLKMFAGVHDRVQRVHPTAAPRRPIAYQLTPLHTPHPVP